VVGSGSRSLSHFTEAGCRQVPSGVKVPSSHGGILEAVTAGVGVGVGVGVVAVGVLLALARGELCTLEEVVTEAGALMLEAAETVFVLLVRRLQKKTPVTAKTIARAAATAALLLFVVCLRMFM
jgi:hypothetical protein